MSRKGVWHSTEELLNFIERNPRLSAWQLAKRLDCDAGGLSGRLKKLSDQGIVQREETESENGRRSWLYFVKKKIEVGRITYTRTNEPYSDNCFDVVAFVAPQPKCSTCGGTGEYEGEYGPRGCGLCNSRLIPIFTQEPNLYVDWGDTVIKYDDGTFEVVSAS